jgi:hypothetical protein
VVVMGLLAQLGADGNETECDGFAVGLHDDDAP